MFKGEVVIKPESGNCALIFAESSDPDKLYPIFVLYIN
jgi:hypothetical protein